MRVNDWRKVSLPASSSKLIPSTVSRVFTPALPTDPVAPVVTAAPVAILDTALAATASATSWVAPRLTMDAVTARPIEALAATPVTRQRRVSVAKANALRHFHGPDIDIPCAIPQGQPAFWRFIDQSASQCLLGVSTHTLVQGIRAGLS